MKALILAAGYATRLYPLTKEYPKPLLAVKGRPIIDYIIDKLDKISEIDEIIVVTNSKFIGRFRKWARAFKSAKPLKLIDDLTKSHSDRRGAIGDMVFVIDKLRIRDDFLVVGADNLFDGSLRAFLSFAKGKATQPVIGAYDIKDLGEAGKYGVLKMDRNKRITDFAEKPKIPRSTLVAMCLYYFPSKSLFLLEEYLSERQDKHDATGFYISWLRKRTAVYGFVFGGRWYDIGDHKFYNAAQKAYLN
jgi:glucose-1-phosphate thymidylyltransferase